MDLYLTGKTALVTGASKGIGSAIAKELAREGVKVFVTGRNQQSLDNLSSEIVAEGNLAPIVFAQDLLAPNAPHEIATAALAALGHIDILINNAGQSQPVDVAGPEEPWTRSMALDFERPRLLTQALLPHFIARKEGTILNLTSTYELRSLNVSAIAKAAMAMWSKQLAGQLGKYGIRVNCLQPGLIDTENIRPYFPGDERRKYAESEIPLQDFGEVQDMANMAVFLVSPRAKYITGTVSVVDGGGTRSAF
ncbi:putative oxidoreductase Rv0769 [Pedobacter sp. Bi27]|uniref:SDR family NAD(P)-dependent oxidoreductase n=1 Tax=unclassified Pedobacter TaxID=2628915 RepID=UPI001D873010|nr:MULTISPECIES: SDR family oxidoreductase [unclassified Pedobacter]CAH0256205.1 putative oxidoreductase Rv0769 [Pedobacter sp. Bi36]CAH0283541.1 putative oxidoreductase Rv0769 [Pedobacter sp. Bi126]CAH0286989.1 putative oxidoreductase Rv0769 [Pedobacter sp. Bi27]